MADKSESLCWRCKKPGTGGCSWDRCFVPVEGWEAELREYPGACSHPKYSYHVVACPLFEKDDGFYKVHGGRPSVIPKKALEMLVRSGWSCADIASIYSLNKSAVERKVAMMKGGLMK
jgi:hypothetical protein